MCQGNTNAKDVNAGLIMHDKISTICCFKGVIGNKGMRNY